MMTPSPENDQTAEMLRGLHSLLTKLDPTEHMAHCHVDMSIDPDRDLGTLMLAYAYDEENAKVHFDELQSFFDDNFTQAKKLLANKWDIYRRLVPWPEDESQHAASYLVNYRGEEFKVSTARWSQPVPDGEPVEMIATAIDPKQPDSPTIRIIYLGDEPLVSRKFNSSTVDNSNAIDSGMDDLSPDDIMTAEKVVRSALLCTV